MHSPRIRQSKLQASKLLVRVHSVHALIRWALALGWTALTCGLMLLPGPKGSPVDNVSRFFGGTELTDAIGHVIIFATLALLWQWTLRVHIASDRALRAGLLVALLLGVFTEIGQSFVPNRGANLWDLLANIGGVSVAHSVSLRLFAKANIHNRSHT